MLHAPLAEANSSRGEEELLGLMIKQHELGTLLVIEEDGRYWLPLEEFTELVSIRIVSGANKGPVHLATPIGQTSVGDQYLATIHGIRYIDQRFFERRLQATLEFDEENYALQVDFPWQRGARPREKSLEQLPDLVPDVGPPDYGLATIHGDLYYSSENLEYGTWRNSLRATGHAYGGVWQVVYDDDIAEYRRVRDFVWMKQLDEQRAIQVGHQRVFTHPVLGTTEFTGVQYAWSNRPIIAAPESLSPGALLTRYGQPRRTFAGVGPVGGSAELWVNDRRESSTRIGISGEYEFAEVILPTRQSSIEIRLYDHRNRNEPVEIINDTMNLSELLLEEGGVTVVSGGGIGGNGLDYVYYDDARRFDDDDHNGRSEHRRGRGATGFVHARYAPRDDVTLEAALEASEDDVIVLAGVVTQLFDEVLVSAAVASNQRGKAAYGIEAYWADGPVDVFIRSRWEDKHFRYNTDKEYWEHHGEVAYQYSETLRLGLVARHRHDAQFVLPFAYWQPNSRFYLRAYPDTLGEYRIDVQYTFSPESRLYASMSRGNTYVSYTDGFYRDITFIVDFERDYRGRYRASAGLAGEELLGHPIAWRLSAQYNDGSLGAKGYLRKEIYPGVLGYVEFGNDGFHDFDYGTKYDRGDSARNEYRIRVGVTFDLAVADDGLRPAPRQGIRADVGGIAGRIDVGGLDGDQSLADIPIVVNGRVASRTDADGRFFIRNLKQGVHVIELDETGLPIEYVPGQPTIIAEVAPGAVTSFDFETHVEFGAAGRVLDAAGEGVPDLTVLVVDAGGNEIGRTDTNSFGYYRVDGLAPGSYVVKTDGAKAVAPRSRSFSIGNDYVFGVDLKVPRSGGGSGKRRRLQDQVD